MALSVVSRPCHARSDPALALPRRAEEALLHRVVREHLATFLALGEERGGLPRFVEAEFRRFVACGVAAHGFLRVHCSNCGQERLVPWSCKGRGFCGSCGGRRMAEGAAHLVDGVLPRVPVRQWVLSLPFELRFRLAHDHALLTAVLGVVMRAILGFQGRRALRELGVRGDCGAVSIVQRFGGAIQLNIDVHAIVLDGVHVVGADGSVRFHALDPPSPSQRREITRVLALRVRALLQRRGLLADDGASEVPGAMAEGALATCQAASVRGVVALGARSGRPVRRIRPPAFARERASDADRGVGGFDLDVGPVVAARDRRRLERLARYVLRPALASERLEELPDGKLRYEFSRPWRDGTVAVELEPLDLLARLASLVPAPRRHLLRYHGTLAPHARLRSRIVPAPPPGRVRRACRADVSVAACTQAGAPRGRGRTCWRIPWAQLLRRVFLVDALRCARCGGEARVVGIVDNPSAARLPWDGA